jgi:hypothetical protein
MTASNHEPGLPIYQLWQRLGKPWRSLAAAFCRAETPAIRTFLPAAAPADDAGIAAEELPPEPAWVELSRSCWF